MWTSAVEVRGPYSFPQNNRLHKVKCPRRGPILFVSVWLFSSVFVPSRFPGCRSRPQSKFLPINRIDLYG